MPEKQRHSRQVSGKEWLLLLECASPNPDREKLAALAGSVDWPSALELADAHGVIGHLGAALRMLPVNAVSAEHKQALLERHMTQLFLSLKLTAELFRVLEQFSAAHIETVAVKGPALAEQAYGDQAIRRYGDLDFLVRQKDIRKATELLMEAGYQASISLCAIDAGKIPGQHFFAKPAEALIVELHNEMTLRYFPRRLPLEKWFSRKTTVILDGRGVPTLSAEDSLILICIHGAKHFWTQLMWLADVAAMIAHQNNLNWEKTFASAKETGAEHILGMGLLLAEELLNAPVPQNVSEKVHNDRIALQLAKQAACWVPNAGVEPSGIFQRAAFRARMRGGFFPGLAYLLRISFSPTEDDWGTEDGAARSGAASMLRRPFRLIQKYSRKEKS